ncbi:MAG: RidA family protein [Gramella sp.]|nr:RidA family protein [Christiangramia sp.]
MKNFIFVLITGLFFSTGYAQTPEEKIKDLGIQLPEVNSPSANFVKWRKSGNLLFLSGDGSRLKGKLGQDVSIDEGYAAARETGIEILATLKEACGELSKIKQFVKVRGMVNSTPDFYDQPKVINGFSDLMVEVFGEKGKHARAAVGHCSLPSNIALEIEVIVELK